MGATCLGYSACVSLDYSACVSLGYSACASLDYSACASLGATSPCTQGYPAWSTHGRDLFRAEPRAGGSAGTEQQRDYGIPPFPRSPASDRRQLPPSPRAEPGAVENLRQGFSTA